MALIAEARKWVGTPYLYGGQGLEPGEKVDCSRLIQRVVKKVFDLDIPRTSADQWDSRLLGDRIAPADLTPGDLVFFKWPGNPRVTHVGVYTGRDRVGIQVISAQGTLKKPDSVKESTGVTSVWFGEIVGGRRL